MRTMRSTLAAAITALAMIPVASAVAQDQAKVHGHVQNPAGQPVTTGEVRFTKDKSATEKDPKMLYTFPLDGQGNYTGTGIAPGDYFVYVTAGDKHVDRLDLKVAAGDDKTLDFDMTRAEYIKSLTPEEKKALEEYKKKNADVTNANKVIANLNKVLAQSQADVKAAHATNADVSKDVDAMKGAVDAKPDEAVLWIAYGDTLQAQGDHLAQADRDDKKLPTSDDAVVKEYSDAADAYKKGIELSAAAKNSKPADRGVANNQLGNTLAKAGKTADAVAAFDAAATVEPANAGMYYNNEAAILFNGNKIDEALAAAEKAIAADPTRPDPYFIKGQALVQHATVDPKTQLPVAPPGCIEAYQKYLELAPDGKNAPAVKDVLAGFGQKIDTKYKAPKK